MARPRQLWFRQEQKICSNMTHTKGSYRKAGRPSKSRKRQAIKRHNKRK